MQILGLLNLSSCWIHVNGRFTENDESVENYVKEILNVSENYGVESMITTGYPDEDKKTHDEIGLNYDKAHYEKF